MKYLTDKEVKTIKGMGRYWREVSGREDKSPLGLELQQVFRTFGTNILWVLLDYVETSEKAEHTPELLTKSYKLADKVLFNLAINHKNKMPWQTDKIMELKEELRKHLRL